jgi:hypothetical protein
MAFRTVLPTLILRLALSIVLGAFYTFAWFKFINGLPWYLEKYTPIILVLILILSTALTWFFVKYCNIQTEINNLMILLLTFTICWSLLAFLSWREVWLLRRSSTSLRTLDYYSCWTGTNQLLKVPSAFIIDENHRRPWTLSHENKSPSDRIEITIQSGGCHKEGSIPREYFNPKLSSHCNDSECTVVNIYWGDGKQDIHFPRKLLPEVETIWQKVNALIESWHHG